MVSDQPIRGHVQLTKTMDKKSLAGVTFALYREAGSGVNEEAEDEENDVLVLAQTAERPEEIDANRARAAAAQAKEAMLQKRSIQEYRIAKQRMARELNRLRVSRKAGS